MVITYNGGNYFRIQAGNLTVLVDPENQRSFKGADLVLMTGAVKDEVKSEGGPAIIPHQGEYEVKGIRISGWDVAQGTIYKIEMDEMVLGILGPLAEIPDEKVLHGLKGLDVLFVPAGGKPYLPEKEVGALIKKLSPSMVIPSLFKNLKNFLKEIGVQRCDEEDKLTFKKKDLKPGGKVIKCLKF